MDEIIIKPISVTDPAYSQVYDLRETILRKPIGLSLRNEDLGKDGDDIILVAWNGAEIVACVMLKHTDQADVFKLRQMAVAELWQGKGVGRQLVLAAEELLAGMHVCKIILHARITAEDFYTRLGYKKTSDIFTEVGIPHIIMEKLLQY